MDHAGDILNYIQRRDSRMAYDRSGVDIHEFFLADNGETGAALVWAKDQFAVIEVTAGDDEALDRWRSLVQEHEMRQGPILYAGERPTT